MTAPATVVDKPAGDWDLRGYDVDTVFSTMFTSDDCMDALTAAQAQFHDSFPGWALYRRVLIGDALLDRTLEAYAIGMARAVSRSVKDNGRPVVAPKTRTGGWVAQAGRDGLDYALFGKFPCGVDERCRHFQVSNKPYQRVRDAVAGGIWTGIGTFQAQVHCEYWKIKRRRKYLPSDCMG